MIRRPSLGMCFPAATAFAALLLGACVVAPPRGAVFVRIPPPAAVVEVRGSPPGAEHVWIPGYHAWQGGVYVWVPGHWDRGPHPRAVWVSGQWRHHRDGWFWVEGHWR